MRRLLLRQSKSGEWIAVAALTLFTVSCSSSARRYEQPPEVSRTSLPVSTPTPESGIRSVDFDNITYPNFPDYSDPNGRMKKHITLKPGEAGPNFINYGDITGDGQEEAMVELEVENNGSAVPGYVYIFTMQNGKPKLIWDFETGDRADGGLRNVYADNGTLVVELFGKDRVIGGQLYRGEEGLCCPSSFTQTRYKWTGRRFEQVSTDVLKNPSGDANVVMPQYATKK